MSTEKLPKSFHLKQVVITPAQTADFKSLIVGAWNKLTEARSRSHKVSADSEQYRVMNHLEELGLGNKVAAASVFAFTMNANQNAVELQQKVRSFNVSVLAPPRDDKKRLEFIEGLIYLATKKNYIAIMANRAISFKTLEEYLSWLLSKSTGQTLAVSLIDPPKPDLKDYDMNNVTSIVFNGHVMTEQRRDSGGARTKVQSFGVAREAIDGLFKSLGGTPPVLPAEKAGDLDMLEVSVSVTVKRRGDYHNAGLAARKIAESMRDLEKTPPVSFGFGDGRKLDVANFRVHCSLRVPCENDIPNAYESMKLLHEWLNQQVTNIENPK